MPVPLSYPQERFWILQQLHPATGAFNLSFCARLGVALDESLLGRAVDVLVERHAALRTVLRAGVEGPVQAIDVGRRPVLEVVDLRTRRRTHGARRPCGRPRRPSSSPLTWRRGRWRGWCCSASTTSARCSPS
jgi:hypothetical protein